MSQLIRHSRIATLSILIVLTLSTFIPAIAYAAPQASSAEDWQYVNGNSWAWNYSPETQINKNNVDQLEVKWLFPLQGKTAVNAGMSFLISERGAEGSTTPPIVRDGTVYVTSNFMRTYAVNAETGKQLWTNDYVVDIDEIQQRLPVLWAQRPHFHGIRYWEGGDAIIYPGIACDIYGIDAKTGSESFWIKDLCTDIPGNLYKYYGYAGIVATSSQASIGTYEKGNQFLFVLPGSVHGTWLSGDGRHVTMGIDMDTHQIIWRVFSYPRHDIPQKDWALQECDIGFFQDIPCSDVEAQAPENLEWDWAQPGETPSIWGGVTANWGQSVVDEDTGIVYTQTGNQGPYTYVGETPGPRLYGSTIMAIDMDTGERLWWMQPFPRDPFDYDCNWGGILAEIDGLGKVYMKGCKEGRLNVLDADTGEPLYIVDVIDEQYEWGQITRAGTLEYQEGGIKYHLNDPFSHYDMRELEAPELSPYCSQPCPVYPFWSNGIFGTDKSYDPNTQTLYHYAVALQTEILGSNVPPVPGAAVSSSRSYPIMNTTLVARDVATGEVKWTWYYDYSSQRSHMVVTPEMLFAGFTDGFMRFFDKNNGDLLREMNLGSLIGTGATTGQDSKGDQKVFVLVGTAGTTPTNPGTLVAIGLSERAAAGVRTTTVTTTARTTITTSTTLTSATTRTITTTSATTVTSTLAPQTITTTTTAPAQTVTQEVTETTGLPAEVTYAAVAIAVIAIIAAAMLTMRKK